MCTLRVERAPRDPAQDLARAPTFSRLAHQVTRTDLYRVTQAFVDHCMASSPEPPAAIVFDRDHPEAPTHGQQEFPCSNHHSQRHGSLPRCIFAGTSHAVVTAVLRPGKRPPGAENAMRLVRLLAALRRQWPVTHLLIRGDRHFATPEVMEVIAYRRHRDVVCGLAGNPVLLRQAAPVMQEARGLFQQRAAVAHASGEQPPPSTRLSEEFSSAAASWEAPWRVIVKAEVMAAGDTPRFVVTS
jgi:Transposase DDE domain group 1